jgi:hypothetical protein
MRRSDVADLHNTENKTAIPIASKEPAPKRCGLARVISLSCRLLSPCKKEKADARTQIQARASADSR